MPEREPHKTECPRCKATVVEVGVSLGKHILLDPEPGAGGVYALHDFGGSHMLATKPPAHLAFGRSLYVAHKCSTRVRRAGS